MKLPLEKLKSNLSPLQSCYILSGSEPLLVLEACDLIRKHAGEKIRETYAITSQFDWSSLLSDIQHASLFANEKLIEIKCDTLKVNKALGEHLKHCVEANHLGHTLLITLPKLESETLKTKWFSALEKISTFVQIWPIEREHLPRWIKQRLKAAHCPTDEKLIDALVNMSEGNLLAAHQHITRLSLTQGSVPEMIKSLSDQARFTSFDWVKSVLEGELKRSEHILSHLKNEGIEPILILWAIAQELRLCALAMSDRHSLNDFYKSHRIWPKRQAPMTKLIKRSSLPVVYNALKLCAHIDGMLKGADTAHPWQHLSKLSFNLAAT